MENQGNNSGSVTRLMQSAFEGGIQELNVYLDNDVAVPQKWKWPEVRREGDAGSYSLHDVYVRLFEAGMESDELYLFVTNAAEQVGGQTLSQAQPVEGAGEEEEEEDDLTQGGDDANADNPPVDDTGDVADAGDDATDAQSNDDVGGDDANEDDENKENPDSR